MAGKWERKSDRKREAEREGGRGRATGVIGSKESVSGKREREKQRDREREREREICSLCGGSTHDAVDRVKLRVLLSPVGIEAETQEEAIKLLVKQNLDLQTRVARSESEKDELRERLRAIEERETDAAAAFSAFSPDSLSDLRAVRACMESMAAPDVLTHVQKLQSYITVGQQYQAGLATMQQFLKDHPREQVASDDCTALQESLSTIQAQLVEAATLLAEEEQTFDPADSVSYLSSVAVLLSDISSLSPVPLPQDTTNISLSHKGKYFDAYAFNRALHYILTFAKPLFEHEAAVNECMAGIESVGVMDTGVCDKACEAGARLLRVAE
ncbi:hypothetical protein KIPB_009028, partial [Kipferlia bialata]|eukprot:g9028.t1